jgi:hypothetical protein
VSQANKCRRLLTSLAPLDARAESWNQKKQVLGSPSLVVVVKSLNEIMRRGDPAVSTHQPSGQDVGDGIGVRTPMRMRRKAMSPEVGKSQQYLNQVEEGLAVLACILSHQLNELVATFSNLSIFHIQ